MIQKNWSILEWLELGPNFEITFNRVRPIVVRFDRTIVEIWLMSNVIMAKRFIGQVKSKKLDSADSLWRAF